MSATLPSARRTRLIPLSTGFSRPGVIARFVENIHSSERKSSLGSGSPMKSARSFPPL